MNRFSTVFATLLGGAAALTAGASAQEGVSRTDLETALNATGWDIIHTATGEDGSVSIGARSRDGWPVIHTLSGCEGGTCSSWVQETPFEAGFVKSSVSFDALPEGLTNRVGNSLMAEKTEGGSLALRGAVLGAACDSTCQMGAIESFAWATKVTYTRMTGGTMDVHQHGLWSRVGADAAEALPMDHRQIAAIAVPRVISRHLAEADPLGRLGVVPQPQCVAGLVQVAHGIERDRL